MTGNTQGKLLEDSEETISQVSTCGMSPARVYTWGCGEHPLSDGASWRLQKKKKNTATRNTDIPCIILLYV